MDTDTEQQTRKYRQMLNDIHAINAEIRPLLTRTILISLNAEIASAKVGQLGQPFSVVAREMGKISGILGGLMQEVEVTIQRAIQEIAHWFQTRKKLELLGRSVVLQDAEAEALMPPAGTSAGPPAVPDAASHQAEPAQATVPMPALGNGDGRSVQGRLHQMEQQMAELLATVRDRTHDLHGLLEGMSNSVGRESRYLGLFAKIEAAHINDSAANLSGVALAIQDLATQIDDALAHAKARIVA